MRELRDQENRDFVLDKNYLELKHLKEKVRAENLEDPQVLKMAGLSYIAFLNKKQKQQDKLNRGMSGGDDEDDDNQSEDESNASDDYKKNKAQTKDFDKNNTTQMKDGKN